MAGGRRVGRDSRGRSQQLDYFSRGIRSAKPCVAMDLILMISSTPAADQVQQSGLPRWRCVPSASAACGGGELLPNCSSSRVGSPESVLTDHRCQRRSCRSGTSAVTRACCGSRGSRSAGWRVAVVLSSSFGVLGKGLFRKCCPRRSERPGHTKLNSGHEVLSFLSRSRARRARSNLLGFLGGCEDLSGSGWSERLELRRISAPPMFIRQVAGADGRPLLQRCLPCR